jgi:hypothetical protein
MKYPAPAASANRGKIRKITCENGGSGGCEQNMRYQRRKMGHEENYSKWREIRECSAVI